MQGEHRILQNGSRTGTGGTDNAQSVRLDASSTGMDFSEGIECVRDKSPQMKQTTDVILAWWEATHAINAGRWASDARR